MRASLAPRLAVALALSISAAHASAQSTTPARKKTVPPTPVVRDDKDVVPAGATGIPRGFIGRTDRPDQNLGGARYVAKAGAWDITTGPAHILYAVSDTASGNYTVTATINQLATPKHPEAFGVFVGGQNLSTDAQSYLYFLVRGTGDMLARVREGETTRGVIAWQPTKAAPAADAAGMGSYKIAIQVAPDSVKFWVNGRQAAAVPSASLPTNGVFGIRVNHNLHVLATTPVLTRP